MTDELIIAGARRNNLKNIEKVNRPDVDSIRNVRPAIALGQRNPSRLRALR